MNIVFVTREYIPSKRAGGIATYVWETARALSAKGHNIYVIAASDDIKKETESVEDGVNLIRLAGGDFYISKNNRKLDKIRSRIRSIFCHWSYRRRISKRLNKLISEKVIDIVEFAEYGNEMAYWLCHNQNQVPWIVRLHGPALLDRTTGGTISYLRKPISWFFSIREIQSALRASAITSPSMAQAKWFLEMSCSARNIEIIPNTVSTKDWKSSITLRDEKNPIKIFSAGSIVEGKGFADLLKACLILRGNGIDLNLIFAGKMGKLGKKLTALSVTTSYKNWFTVLGPIKRDKLKSFYASSDIVVFPSWWESFGLVCVEAMASSALVVGSASGGMAEIIEDGIDGFLVPPKSPQLLANKLNDIIAMPQLAKEQIRLAASEKARRKYDAKIVLKQQIEFYESIIRKSLGKQ